MLGLDNPIHLLFLLVLLLLVFGAKRLPEMGRSLGTGLRGFKESINGEHGPAQMGADQPTARVDELPAPSAITADPLAAPVADRSPIRPVA